MNLSIAVVKVQKRDARAKADFQDPFATPQLSQTEFDPPPVHGAEHGPVIEPERVAGTGTGIPRVRQQL